MYLPTDGHYICHFLDTNPAGPGNHACVTTHMIALIWPLFTRLIFYDYRVTWRVHSPHSSELHDV